MRLQKLPSFFLFVFAVGSGGLAHAAEPGKTAPLNVLDYYLLLPEKEISLLDYTKKPRKALIQHQDIANGYLDLSAAELQGIVRVALFRQKNHEALIGVSQTEQGVASSGSVKFLQYGGDGQWSDATAAVLPKIADAEILAAYNRIKKGEDPARSLEALPAVYWELPKKGTTLEMRCGEDSDSKDKPLLRFAWNGARFTKQTQ